MSQLNNPLPPAYEQQMQSMLQEEADAFLASYYAPRAYGLRIHSRKWPTHPIARERTKILFQLRSIPWCEEGYYYEANSRPGKHPYHAAGFYYIQEPSAMSAVALLDPQPGECVLDLAGAPGGKSTQIAGKLQGEGLLIANEIHRERSRILAENVERMGWSNVIVTNSDPDTLAERFPEAFDCIMLDAPCSGEGMFRKDPDAIAEWSPEHVALCAARQWDIIQAAVRMLRPGGRIGYSTCTFNEEENERIIERWLENYPAFQVERMERIWPHRHEGEGHFVAVLRLTHTDGDLLGLDAAANDASLPLASQERKRDKKRAGGRPSQVERTHAMNAKEAYALFASWAQEALPAWEPPPGEPILFGDELYWLPASPAGSALRMRHERLNGLRVPRPGLHLAHMRKMRVEPAHALALSLSAPSDAAVALDLDSQSSDVSTYLSGNTLQLPEKISKAKGWVLVTVDGLPLGWGKASDGILKNHYPKGLRLQSL
ncbi:RsmF rRNA methyltransferase first C-terminal domain-containing protein [Paenibacillus marinisediminis]